LGGSGVGPVVPACPDFDIPVDDGEDQDDQDADNDRSPPGSDVLEDHGTPEFKEYDKAEAETRCGSAELCGEEPVVERVAFPGFSIPDDVPGCRDGDTGTELLVLVLAFLAVVRVSCCRSCCTECDTPDEPEQRQRERVSQRDVDQVTDGDSTENCYKGMSHGNRRHGLQDVHVDRLAELGKTCRPAQVCSCRIDALNEDCKNRAQDNRENRVYLHGEKRPCKSCAQSAPQPVRWGFAGDRLIEDAVHESHLRSELNL